VLEIKEITRAEWDALIDSGHRSVHDTQYSPRGLFVFIEGDSITGIDNSTGHAWTEAFGNREKCERWLRGEDDDTQEGEYE